MQFRIPLGKLLGRTAARPAVPGHRTIHEFHQTIRFFEDPVVLGHHEDGGALGTREFAKEFYNLWLNWTEWTIATAPDVNGIAGPSKPDGAAPFAGLAGRPSLAGTWLAR